MTKLCNVCKLEPRAPWKGTAVCAKCNRERLSKLYYSNPDYRAYVIKKAAAWNKNNRERRIAKKYRLSLDQYHALGKHCQICKIPMECPNVDHEHSTGKVRGVLCGRCNKGIGLFDDSPKLLRAAARYLGDFYRL
jgi:hypothetical protein